ncbi:membrane dipeptidase [Candidatus Aerophobetes bacterium]|nr:membrane dipeptidase [Candidatus Aerophobetes bacterium]
MFLEFKNLIIPVTNVKDIEKAKELNKVGIILGFQNTSPLEGNIKFLSVFKEMGVKIIQLTYNERNLVGNGRFERVDGGLSKFGIRIIKEMNKLGILVDLSHVGPKSTMEAIEISEKPVAIPHANSRTLFDYPRNKTDEQIKLLASKGGVIGITFWPFFLSKGINSTIEDYLDNIDYVSDFFLNRSREMLQKLRAGRNQEPSTVQFEWPIIYPEGIRIPEEFPNITYGLLKKGHSGEDVRKIMGENLVRIFREVW